MPMIDRTIKLVLLLAVFAVAGALSALAGDAKPVEIERMTWTEVRDAVAAGKTTIIIPAGGTEQNGRHMVIGKHNMIVAETARRTAVTLGDALVAPVLAYVPEGDPAKREGNMAFPVRFRCRTPFTKACLRPPPAASRSMASRPSC